MLKTTLIAAVLAAAGATAASAQNWRYDHGYRHGGSFQGSDGGLGRYCPPGYYPHSWPNGSGIRCEPAGGSQTFIPSE